MGSQSGRPSILVYGMGEVIGDGVIKLPFVAALRAAFPNAWIVWCAAKGSTVYAGPLKPLVENLIDEVLTTGRLGARLSDHLADPFDGRRFDLVIDTQADAARSLFARRGAAGRAGRYVSSAGASMPTAMLDQLMALLSRALGQPVVARTPTLTHPRALDAARTLLPDGPVYVGLAPGAGGQDKRWPLAGYLELAARVEAAGYRPVFFFGPEEAADLADARAAAPRALYPEFDRADDHGDVCGPLLVIALAGRLAAAVANDAGPGHMLAAGGAPLVSLQKTRRLAEKFRPSARRLELLIAEDHGPDMAAIPVEAAWRALTGLIAAPAS